MKSSFAICLALTALFTHSPFASAHECGVETPTPTNVSGNSTASSLLYSPYIDIGMGTGATLVERMNTAGLDAISLAFATGECGAEAWAGTTPDDVVSLIKTLVDAKKKYIISTGGAAGAFTCGSDDDFMTFIETYSSDYLVGIDFDIETGQSEEVMDNLVLRAKNALTTYPDMRFSFTIASFGQTPDDNILNPTGQYVVKSIQSNELPSYYINLMTMDYGNATDAVCVVTNDECDMGLSAGQAAKSLNSYYSVPFEQIEVTVMIGGNDFQNNVFRMDDVPEVTDFAKANNMGGVHLWSLDRDEDCEPGPAMANCNTYGEAGSLGFSKAFADALA